MVVPGFGHWVSLLASRGTSGVIPSVAPPCESTSTWDCLQKGSEAESVTFVWCLSSICVVCLMLFVVWSLLFSLFATMFCLVHMSTLIRFRPWSCLLSTNLRIYLYMYLFIYFGTIFIKNKTKKAENECQEQAQEISGENLWILLIFSKTCFCKKIT